MAATGEAASLRVHHSFVELPDAGYKPREFDPRAGYFGITYEDYAAPLGEPMTKRFIAPPSAGEERPVRARSSEPVKPIVYYVDPGAPEPIRSALLDGARWWNQAFEAAGYRNAFQVELLPEGVSPLDIRYNVINWVHRSTRGWSTGGTVTDPRTGEIIKGVVTLGSLRVRQDYLIAEGLLPPYKTGDETPPELREWALARIRQLSAHEVGHTLGLGHNYYDSNAGRISRARLSAPARDAQGGRHARLLAGLRRRHRRVGQGRDRLRLSATFRRAPTKAQALAQILDEAWKKDLRYMTNQDTARIRGSTSGPTAPIRPPSSRA